MAKIGMFWGSTTDMTKEASELIHKGLEAAGHEIDSFDIRNTDPSKMLEYNNLLIGCPTWNVGELQDDWEDVFGEYEKLDFSGKTAAFFGIGDQIGYSFNFLDAVGMLAKPYIENGGKLIGKWPTDGYEFDESLGCVDGEFLGLAIDYDNQDELTEERIEAWVDQIKDLFE